MLLRNGTGSMKQGLGTGKRTGLGRGRMGGSSAGEGPGGYCVCPQCGAKVPHQQGTPCYSMKCPKCGIRMVRG